MNELEARAMAVAASVLGLYEGAGSAIASGSILRGQGTPTSDLDLVVLYNHLDRAWRESFVHGDLPVEVWVHDPETLRWFMDRDARLGQPVMAHLVTTGRALGPDTALAARVVAHAQSVLDKGPPALDGEFGRTLRYQLTALLEDISDARDASARRAIATSIYQPLADLMLIGRGAWSGKGKWIPHQLHRLDPSIAATFEAAMEGAWSGDAATLVALIDNELKLHGGRYFAGEKRMAPEGARLPAAR